ncbi:MAG: hypothetical protein MZW92_18805 [Comamonadaceae bacterium]|nr:hypothetical protein [Comamonadaceae bacterium]
MSRPPRAGWRGRYGRRGGHRRAGRCGRRRAGSAGHAAARSDGSRGHRARTPASLRAWLAQARGAASRAAISTGCWPRPAAAARGRSSTATLRRGRGAARVAARRPQRHHRQRPAHGRSCRATACAARPPTRARRSRSRCEVDRGCARRETARLLDTWRAALWSRTRTVLPDRAAEPRRVLARRPRRRPAVRRHRRGAGAARRAGGHLWLPAARQRHADRLRRLHHAVRAGEHRRQRLSRVPRLGGGLRLPAGAAGDARDRRQRALRRQPVPVRRRQRRGAGQRRLLVLLPARLPLGARRGAGAGRARVRAHARRPRLPRADRHATPAGRARSATSISPTTRPSGSSTSGRLPQLARASRRRSPPRGPTRRAEALRALAHEVAGAARGAACRLERRSNAKACCSSRRSWRRSTTMPRPGRRSTGRRWRASCARAGRCRSASSSACCASTRACASRWRGRRSGATPAQP